MGTKTAPKNSSRKKTIKGNRGSRGHGWYVKYREGRGGRHLQGEYWDRSQHHWDLKQWNEAVLSLGSQYVYLDIAVEPPKSEQQQQQQAAASAAAADVDEAQDIDVAAPEVSPDEETSEAKVDATTTTTDEEAKEEEDEEEVEASTTPKSQDNKPDIPVERLIIRVASTVMPETCINFIGLCQEASYKDSILYRIEKQVGICGGDVLTNTGKTGQCWQSFPPPYANLPARPRPSPLRRDLPPPAQEPMALWHTEGVVTMLCAKVNEIDSRFLLCTQDSPHLDGIHRAFGKLEPESLEVVREWQANIVTWSGKPKSAVLRIVDCGVLEDYTAAGQKEETSSNTEAANDAPEASKMESKE